MFLQQSKKYGEGSMSYNLPGFNALVRRRPSYLLKLLEKYPKIIYTDIDTVWLKDPRQFLKGNHDFWAQLDGVLDGTPYVQGFIPFFCTGFLALNKTQKTMTLLKKWNTEVTINGKLSSQVKNQPLFQKVVFEISADGRVLPTKYFPSGRQYFEVMTDEERKDVNVIHNNFVAGKENKIERFIAFDLWSQNIKSYRKCTRSQITEDVLSEN